MHSWELEQASELMGKEEEMQMEVEEVEKATSEQELGSWTSSSGREEEEEDSATSLPPSSGVPV